MKIKIVIVSIGILIFSLLGLYKYNEWKTISDINSFHNTFFVDHFRLLNVDSNLSTELNDIYSDFASKSASKNEKIAQQSWYDLWNDLDPVIKVTLNNYEKINAVLSNGKRENERISKQSDYVLFKLKPIMQTYVSGVDEYINSNQKMLSYDKALGHFLSAYVVIENDFKTMGEFDTGYAKKDLNGIMTYVEDNFSDISTLEKYTHNDFQFENEDIIKETLPESYSFLVKAKQFINSYYVMMKDFAAGDSESAGYKWNKFNSNLIDLNVDVFALDENKSNESKENNKTILEADERIINSLAQLNSTQIKYPLIRTNFAWSDSLVKCSYINTSSVRFHDLTKKYPEAKSFQDLNTELTSKGIYSTNYEYDPQFFQIENNDELMQFTCTNESDQSKFYLKHYK